MQVATGTVVDGKIVLEGVPLPEGARVTVVTRGADESFTLTEAQEDELLAAMAEIEGGEYVTLDDLPCTSEPELLGYAACSSAGSTISCTTRS